jgi:TonB family protein
MKKVFLNFVVVVALTLTVFGVTAQTNTLSGLLGKAKNVESVSFYALDKQDVYSYFELNDKYNSPLKRKVFEQSDEYTIKKDSLRRMKANPTDYVFYLKKDHLFEDARYDPKKGGFELAINFRFDNESGNLFIFGNHEPEYVNIGFKTLPLRIVPSSIGEVAYFLFKTDEQTTRELERFKEENYDYKWKISAYIFFSLSGTVDRTGKYPVMVSDRVRVALVNNETGKIWYDKSFPENSVQIPPPKKAEPEKSLAKIEEPEQKRIEEEKRKEEAQLAEKQHQAETMQSDNIIYTTAETMPVFPGGEQALAQFIGANLKYPEIAIKQGIQGIVVVRFVVGTDGSIGDVQVTRSLEPNCDKEAVRVVKSMPKWKPATQEGKPVHVYYTLPVKFRLSN